MRIKQSAYFLSALVGMALGTAAHADNPIIRDYFSADPAALVHKDKVYLYTGHDEAEEDGDFFVLKEWQIFSSTDLENWKREASVPRTIFEWASRDSAWAAETIEKDGKFYWYVTVHNDDAENPEKNGYVIAVAVSDDPVHGWKDALGKPLVSADMTEPAPHMKGKGSWDDIDPTVFIDDDGQAYLYWGNSHLYYAKLKDNMIELDGEIHKVDIHGMPGTFTEAPWLHKYKGNYYLTFAENYPEELAYAMSDSPTGPWTYKGKLMDTLEDSGTSHPAILNFKDNWYFIYHTADLPTGGNYRRSVAIEKLEYNADGTIDKIVPTASGITHDSYALQSHKDRDQYLRHSDKALKAEKLDGSASYDFKWHLVSGLNGGKNTVSIQPENRPGYYIKRTEDSGITLAKHDGTEAFEKAATFNRVAGLADSKAVSYKALDSDRYLKVEDGKLTLAKVDGAADRKAATFTKHVAE
jgi:hypothetical protein